MNLDTVCVPKQILFFLKHLDIQNLQKVKLKFAAVAILNVIMQQTIFDETVDMEMSIDICRDALKSMTDIVKYDDEEDTILCAAALLCGMCAGASRYIKLCPFFLTLITDSFRYINFTRQDLQHWSGRKSDYRRT